MSKRRDPFAEDRYELLRIWHGLDRIEDLKDNPNLEDFQPPKRAKKTIVIEIEESESEEREGSEGGKDEEIEDEEIEDGEIEEEERELEPRELERQYLDNLRQAIERSVQPDLARLPPRVLEQFRQRIDDRVRLHEVERMLQPDFERFGLRDLERIRQRVLERARQREIMRY